MPHDGTSHPPPNTQSAVKGRRTTTGDGNQSLQRGAACFPLNEDIPNYLTAKCEKVISGQNNAWIVLGRDRPAGELSGHGGKAATRAGAIDIVVGISSANILTNLEDKRRVYTNRNFKNDSARIYISQKANIDDKEYFNIVTGGKRSKNTGSPIARSAIGIKADDVRIISRHSMKLVSGTDFKDSNDGSTTSMGGGIELIAGNRAGDQQHLVKGENLVRCLEHLVQEIDSVSGILNTFLTYQLQYNIAILKHTHPVVSEIAISQMSIGRPDGIPEIPSTSLAAAGIKNILNLGLVVQKDVVIQKAKCAAKTLRYLKIGGELSKHFILSAHNTTN